MVTTRVKPQPSEEATGGARFAGWRPAQFALFVLPAVPYIRPPIHFGVLLLT